MIELMDRRLAFGINPTWHDWVNQPPSWDDLMFDKMAAAHSQSLRSGLDFLDDTWKGVGQYDWSKFVPRVDAALARGIEFIGLIVQTPNWALPPGAPSGQNAFWLPDEQYASDFINACASLASTFTGKIRYFEYWNEPDGGGMNFTVAQYTQWLQRAYQGVKAGNTNALLSVGGLVNADVGFLQGTYNNGGQPYFDAVAVHPYSYDGPINFESIDLKRTEMVNRGDSAKSMWLTEYGWTLNGVTPQQQADWLLQSLQQLWTYTYYYVTQASYNTIADVLNPGYAKIGLCDENLNARPAYNTFQSYAAPRTPRWESKAPFITSV